MYFILNNSIEWGEERAEGKVQVFLIKKKKIWCTLILSAYLRDEVNKKTVLNCHSNSNIVFGSYCG